MKAVISSTFDSNYLFFVPLVTWGWNKLGVDTVLFIPDKESRLFEYVSDVVDDNCPSFNRYVTFDAPKHKEATYAQCLRNYAAALDFNEDEFVCTSDVDMLVFRIPEYIDNGKFSIFGSDLVPPNQYPQCYITGTVKMWRDAFGLYNKTPQQVIDDLLGEDECEHYRGCRWSVDQEQSYLKISPTFPNLISRARPGTQWASKRYDRDDSYLLDRLSLDTIDYHLNRPGYEENNFEIIMKVLKYHYPLDDFGWLVDYRNEYLKLI